METETFEGTASKISSLRQISGIFTMDDDHASRLVGRIVEKGLSTESQKIPLSPLSFPRPTVHPFPVARHRSHGPHWAPMTNNAVGGEDDDHEELDKDETNFDPVSAFANPIHRNPKKGLDLSGWRELIQNDGSSEMSNVSKLGNQNGDGINADLSNVLKSENQNGERIKATADTDTKNTFYSSLPNRRVFASAEGNGETHTDASRAVAKSGKVMTVNSGFGFTESVSDMELDQLDLLHVEENLGDGMHASHNIRYNTIKDELGTMPLKSQIDIKNNSRLLKMPADDIAEMEAEVLEKMSPKTSENIEMKGAEQLEKQKSPLSFMPPSFSKFDNASMNRQIDAENRARLQEMSYKEIAEAQTEIMEKLKPGLIELLKKRGQDKSEKQKSSVLDLAACCQLGPLQNENPLNQNAKDASPSDTAKIFHTMRTISTDDAQSEQDDGGLQRSGPVNSSMWDAWSKRVEAVRGLKFSFDGTVVQNDSVQVTETGDIQQHSHYGADNVVERDFLRTEGDPGAAGYTIKEAVALSRSMVPGQRALALQLLASVLDKALCNLSRSKVGCDVRNTTNVGGSIDWKAVWAFALGPELELILSLRTALDDNHVSVVLACAKVIQCILSYDMNEKFFDISEKVATYDKDICTAPVFRGKAVIDVGFLHGGFWKYSTKPSNALPFSEGTIDDESGGKNTVQDDVIVAGQDAAAGLVRMGILPRIRYLLETNPTVALEECLISVLLGLARHSPTCADAIAKCPRLIQTIIDRYKEKYKLDIRPAKIKSLKLLKVLARTSKMNCIDFIENGAFRSIVWHLYQSEFPLGHWIKSGREYCKLTSDLIVEQLRFWKVCIQYDYCISYFANFFPALHFWLSPHTCEKLIENHFVSEFASITREAYLVLEALARKLPNLHTEEQLTKQSLDFSNDGMETWCWRCVAPVVDLALKWLSLKSNPYLSKIFDRHDATDSKSFDLSSILWVISAVIHMLSSVLERVTPNDRINPYGSGHVPWLPEFVPRIGVEIVKNNILKSFGTNDTEYGSDHVGGDSFIEILCHLRLYDDCETSLSSLSCLCGLIRLVVPIDTLILRAKSNIVNLLPQKYISSKEGQILEDGIILWSWDELKSVLMTFMKLVDSEWHNVQCIEMFGRGGPAPGVALGWGAIGGGFWSTTVLLSQADAGLLTQLLEVFQLVPEKDVSAVEEMKFFLQRINSVLAVCLILGPKDTVIMEKALNILLQAPVLKHLDICIRHFLCFSHWSKPFGWVYREEDYLYFSMMLTSHFRKRWLHVKNKKNKTLDGGCHAGNMTPRNGIATLDTIHEELDPSNMSGQNPFLASLLVEWAQQRFPLPIHWFLSPISMICDCKDMNVPNISNRQCYMSSSSEEVLEVAKSGLFLLLGLEALSFFLGTDLHKSPVQCVPLVWKLHSLSMVLLNGMDVLEEERSRDVYETLQELYGQLLNQSTDRSIKINSENMLPHSGKKYGIELLRFQSDVHVSYATFVETLIEQFAAVSYGDVIYGRQVAIYLHRHVEAPVRLAAWNALSNARILELLPPLEKCFAGAGGYLEPIEDDEGILEAYAKSWISGALDKAVVRNSITYTLVLHHLSCFIFHCNADDKLFLKNKLAKSLMRDYSRKQQHEGIMLDFIQYVTPAKSRGKVVHRSEIERRFQLLRGACEGNSSLLTEVEKLKSCCIR